MPDWHSLSCRSGQDAVQLGGFLGFFLIPTFIFPLFYSLSMYHTAIFADKEMHSGFHHVLFFVLF
jgi:hypothetical protein